MPALEGLLLKLTGLSSFLDLDGESESKPAIPVLAQTPLKCISLANPLYSLRLLPVL